eukprot:4133571-Heterocapsa_arctica.AAC.1
MSDNGARYDRNAAIAVPDDDDFGKLVSAIGPDIFGQPTTEGDAAPPGLGQGVHATDWDIWGSKLVDLKGVAKPPEFRGEDQE